MSILKFKYTEPACKCDCDAVCAYCFEFCTDLDCEYSKSSYKPVGMISTNTGVTIISDGNCVNAYWKTIIKSVTALNYTVEMIDDIIILTIGRKSYECSELNIDGKEINLSDFGY